MNIKFIILSALIHFVVIISSGVFKLNSVSFDKLEIKLPQGFQPAYSLKLVDISIKKQEEKKNNENQKIKESQKNKYFFKIVPGVKSKFFKGIKNPVPEYPEIAKKWGWEGEVLFRVYITKNGKLKKVILLKSSGYKILDESAIKDIKKWRFPNKNKEYTIDFLWEYKIGDGGILY